MTDQQLNEMGFYKLGRGIFYGHERFMDSKFRIQDTDTLMDVLGMIREDGKRQGLTMGIQAAQAEMRIALGIDPPHSREDEY